MAHNIPLSYLIANTILATQIENASNECGTCCAGAHVPMPYSLRSIAYTSTEPLCSSKSEDRSQRKKTLSEERV